MMRKRSFFLLMLTAIAFTACSGDDVLPEGGGNDGGGTDLKGDAWISLRVNTTPSSRALGTPDQENGTADESKVTSARALFFDNALKLVADVTLTGSSLGLPGQPTGEGGTAFQVSKNAKHVLIVVNPSNLFTTFNVKEDGSGDDYATVNAAIAAATVDNVTKPGGTGVNRNYFMMTNAKGYLEPSDASGNLTALALSSNAALAEASPLTVNVDRVSAKVRVYTGGPLAGSNNLIGTVDWVLNVTNRKFYPASQRTMTWNEDISNIGGNWNNTNYPQGPRTPYDTYKIGSYRIDPNYNAGNIGVWDADNTDDYDANYDYFTGTGPATWNAVATSQYCLENTQIATYNTHAYSTQVVLRAQYAPQGLLDVSGVALDPQPAVGDSWIRIGSNGFYTYTSLIGYINKELTLKFGNLTIDPSTIATHLTDAFNSFLTTNGGGAVTIPATWDAFKTLYDNNPNDGTLSPVEITAGVADLASQLGGKTLTAGTVGPVSYYAGGYSYYKIIIKHDNVDEEDIATGEQYLLNELGEFGVVRNSVYDITVNKIINPGYPIIPDPDPTKPDEEDQNWLSIKININPWTWYKQGVDL